MMRIKELDFLRGLAAFGIMIYHYMKWLYIYGGANTFIGRVGVYGVEIFYVLSGITLYHVYHNQLSFQKKTLLAYFTKRFFRIFPLFWLSILLTVLIGLKRVALGKLFLNVSGLFSVFAWEKYIATGTWSIGNELVFYLLFPFLLYFSRHKVKLFAGIGLFVLIIFNYFAFYIFNPFDTLHNQWKMFVNPLNHLLFFYSGMLIPMIIKRKNESSFGAIFMIVAGAFLLFSIPSGNDGIHLLFGIPRYVYTLGSLLICAGFYQYEFQLPQSLKSSFISLGEMSYAIYLLHPFTYQLLCNFIRKLSQIGYIFPQSNTLLIFISVSFTMVVSYLTYIYFEKYFIKKGGKLVTNFYKS